jgi:hypothetical protein
VEDSKPECGSFISCLTCPKTPLLIKPALGYQTPATYLNRGMDFCNFIFYVLYSILLHLTPPLRFHGVGRMLGLHPRLLQFWHWLTDALTTRLDLNSLQGPSYSGIQKKQCGLFDPGLDPGWVKKIKIRIRDPDPR